MFDIRKSRKSYIESPEHFIVVKEATVFLRIVGQEGSYTLLTATSGEDSGEIVAFGDLRVLNEAASRVSVSLNLRPQFRLDHANREYVEVGSCEYLSDAYRVAEMLFEDLEKYPGNSVRGVPISQT